MDAPDDGELGDLESWLDRSQSPWRAGRVNASDGTQHEVWELEILDRDIHRVVTEFLALARKQVQAVTTIQDLAANTPHLYAVHVVENAVWVLGQYALHASPQLEIERVFKSCYWLVAVAQQEGIISKDPDERSRRVQW